MITKSPISMNDIELGQTLEGDVVDANDRVVLRRGLKMSSVLQDVWRKLGDGPFFMAKLQTEETFSSVASEDVIAEFDAKLVAVVRQWYAAVVNELQVLVTQFSGEDNLSLKRVEDALDTCWELLKRDTSIVIFEGLTLPANSSPMIALAQRSSVLAAVSMAVARQYGLSREECAKIGLAALLHDLALYPPILNRFQDAFDRPEEKQSVITRHPYFTTDLLTARAGVHDVVRIVINQVHEQMDGSGYPRGLPGHLINAMARVVNLTDAFLSLIALCSDEDGFVAGDAIAYLLRHASRGVFDCEILRAFLETVSLYGIGSRVELEDGREAIVLRSVENNAMQPIVAIVSDDGAPLQTLNLETDGISIAGPVLDARYENRQRLPRSRMDEVLWLHSQLGSVEMADALH